MPFGIYKKSPNGGDESYFRPECSTAHSDAGDELVTANFIAI